MPRGYRLSVVAAFGWLIFAASPPSQAAEGNEATSQQADSRELGRIAAALEKLPETPAPDAGCDAGEDDRSSDLCAQWKAADAAFSSAVWTKRSFFAGLVGLVIGGFTLVAAGFAAWYARSAWLETRRGNIVNMRASARATRQAIASGAETRRALEISERNAAASEMNVKETQRIGEAQVRCYLTATSASIWVKSDGDAVITTKVKNTGQSPAIDVKWKPEISVMRVNMPETFRNLEPVPDEAVFEYDIASGQEEELVYHVFHGAVSTDAEVDGDLMIAVVADFKFSDVFGKSSSMKARFSWLLPLPVERQRWHIKTAARKVRIPEAP